MASYSSYGPATTSQSDVPTKKAKATSEEKLTAERLLKFILFNEDRADVHFLFPSETEAVVRLPGHKLILATRSSVFGAQFSGRFADEDECRISDVSSDSFREFLRYLYTDTIEATELWVFAELFYLSEKYMIHTMKDDLIQKLNEIMGKHDVLELLTPPLSNHLTKEAVFNLIDERIDHVLQSPLFLQLPKEVVKDILQRDSLKCNEMTIYSGMIKWAEAECKRNDWPADGEGLRRALDELLHLIRFPAMSGEEFNNGPVGKGLFEGKEAYDLLLCINSLQTKKELRKMATVGLTTTSQSDVVKAPKKPKVTSEEKKAPAHPTYAEMVVASISALADRKGSSRIAIANYVLQNYNVGGDSKKVNLHVGVNLKKGADSGLLQQAAKVAAKKAARKTTTKSPKEATTSKSPKKAATTKSLKVVGKKTAVEEKKAATSKKSTVKTAKGDSATLKAKSPKKATAKSAKMANSDSSIPKAPKKATVKVLLDGTLV
ncbi:unnamed protein product, partial [Mesorhabditis belari]|uniref:BTB domain-containing protein n=1 Tax=Mesorhabditis belari TaxID=2138241 RepID=A0AAF3EVD7_9BILA